MARVRDNLITLGLSGAINHQLVFKTRNGKTFISKYPNMKKVVASEKQLLEKSIFRDAVHYAQSILADPEKRSKIAKRTPTGKLVYHQAIKEFYALRK